MICSTCNHIKFKKHGHDPHGNQRYCCLLCGVTWIPAKPKPLGDMRIDENKAIQVLEMLLEGVSIRSTVRLTKVAKGTILSLLELVGKRALQYWGEVMTNLPCNNLQVDELWGYVGMKEKTRRKVRRDYCDFGDAYCFTAVERDTKLMVTWHLGKRTKNDTVQFAEKVRRVTLGRFQLSTDGYTFYPKAIQDAFNGQVDYGQIVKIYGAPRDGLARYSPPEIIDVHKNVIIGNPVQSAICTSHVERVNLSIRMGMRRMTRLTNAFSKKWENHEYALALYFLYYNFCRPHMTLSKAQDDQRGRPTTPAMAAGLADNVWGIKEMLNKIATHS
jgi:IS1 family transposase/transposase-like protein